MPATRRVEVQPSAFSRPIGFTLMDCASCAVMFAVTDEFNARRLYDGATFYCPLGHANVYNSESENLKKQLAEAERIAQVRADRIARLNSEVDQVRADNASLQRSRSAIQGQLTKTRKRIENGVCPACHRHFTNVERHMTSKHKGGLTDA